MVNGDYSSMIRDRFRRFANASAIAMGSSWAFGLAIVVILIWAVSGPVFGFSDTWQLIINTGTTIVTFLMVFLIQSSQNRDSKAIHLKLDELVRAVAKARTGLMGLETMTEEEIHIIEQEFRALKEREKAAPQKRNNRTVA